MPLRTSSTSDEYHTHDAFTVYYWIDGEVTIGVKGVSSTNPADSVFIWVQRPPSCLEQLRTAPSGPVIRDQHDRRYTASEFRHDVLNTSRSWDTSEVQQ